MTQQNGLLAVAACMRSNGVAPASIDPNAPQVSSTIRACQRVMHANNPLVTMQ